MRTLLVRYGLAMTSVVLVAFLVPLGLLSRSLAHDRALAAARQDAQSVAVFAGGTARDDARLQGAVLQVNDGPRRTTVLLPGGRQVGADAVVTPSIELAQTGLAVTARTPGGVEVLLPVGLAEGVAVVRTFVPDGELTAGVTRSWLVLAGVGGLLLLGTAVAGDRIARRLARSAGDLADVAERLGGGDLTARVAPSGPREIATVGAVLNGLGERVGGLLAAERELVADLSHRLRTPITALRLDVDGLADPQERLRMSGHVDQLVHAVDAVVWTARHSAHETTAGGCDAAAVVAERAAFWGVLAEEQGRPFDAAAGAAAPVPVGAADLGAALDVLVDNVFSHTPEGTGFRLAVEPHDGWVDVVVQDDGPGFAATQLTGRGRSGAGSTGLGLDVARRTAEHPGGSFLVESPAGGGSRVVLRLPALTRP